MPICRQIVNYFNSFNRANFECRLTCQEENACMEGVPIQPKLMNPSSQTKQGEIALFNTLETAYPAELFN